MLQRNVMQLLRRKVLTDDEIEVLVSSLSGDVLCSNKHTKVEDIFGPVCDASMLKCLQRAYLTNKFPKTHAWYKDAPPNVDKNDQKDNITHLEPNLVPDPVNDRFVADKVDAFEETIVLRTLVPGVSGDAWTRNPKRPDGPQYLLTTKHRALAFYSVNKKHHDSRPTQIVFLDVTYHM
jgi:hypothetical protein